MSRRRDDDEGNNDGAEQREGLGVGKRLEKLAFGPFHREDRKEAHHGGENGRRHGPADLRGAPVDTL